MRYTHLILALTACGLALAQQKPQKLVVGVDGPAQAHGNVFHFQGAGPVPIIEHLSARSMKGAPYAAEASTETVQMLADGNRIVHRQTSRMWRDSEGRTRQENAVAIIGNWKPEGGDFTIISINDPVSGEHFTLNTKEKTAGKFVVHKAPLAAAGHSASGTHSSSASASSSQSSAAGPAHSSVTVERKVVVGEGPAKIRIEGGMPHSSTAVAGVAGPDVADHFISATIVSSSDSAASGDTKQEGLGTQEIEGLACEGTRSTWTIPAGQVGNERPILVVTERWFSKDLGFDVLRKHSDPRSGETTYRVWSIVRAEQPRHLFEVPADYKVSSPLTEDISTEGGKVKVVTRHGVAKDE